MVLTPWAIVAEAEPAAEKRRQQAGFVAIVGHWLPVDDGGPASKADGEKWITGSVSGTSLTLEHTLDKPLTAAWDCGRSAMPSASSKDSRRRDSALRPEIHVHVLRKHRDPGAAHTRACVDGHLPEPRQPGEMYEPRVADARARRQLDFLQ